MTFYHHFHFPESVILCRQSPMCHKKSYLATRKICHKVYYMNAHKTLPLDIYSVRHGNVGVLFHKYLSNYDACNINTYPELRTIHIYSNLKYVFGVTCNIITMSSPVAQCVARRAPMQQCVRWLIRAPSSS